MKSLVHWRSLRARLLLGAALWVSLGVIGSGVAVSSLFRQHVTDQFTHELSDHLTELQNLYEPNGPGRLLRPVSDPRFNLARSGYYWEIVRPDGLRLRSPSLEARNLSANGSRERPLGGTIEGSAERLILIERATALKNVEPKTRFLAAGDELELRRTIANFDRMLAAYLTFVALGLFLAVIVQVGFGLRPLRRLRVALTQVHSGISAKLPDNFPTEIQPLVSDLNAVIADNHEILRRARAQAGNLGHALRTHLAILNDSARHLNLAGQQQIGEQILAECKAMSRQVDYQVARARAAASRTVVGAPVSPVAIAGDILSALGRLHGSKGITLTNDIASDLVISCDPDDLNEMMANLAENAIKWTRTGVWLSSAIAANNRAQLIFEDDGPGVPEEDWPAVFELGVRMDERVAGSGLGLAIVRDLAELYGGSVYFTAPRRNGARVVLELPMRALSRGGSSSIANLSNGRENVDSSRHVARATEGAPRN